MGLLNWLRARGSNSSNEAPTFDKDEEEFEGLNLKQIITAHLSWRNKLAKVLDGTSSEKLDVHQIAPDDLCTLGKWLYAHGRDRFGRLAEYKSLLQTHKEFHLMAGQIALEFNNGQKERAEELLNKDLRALSDQIQLDIVRLYASQRQ